MQRAFGKGSTMIDCLNKLWNTEQQDARGDFVQLPEDETNSSVFMYL